MHLKHDPLLYGTNQNNILIILQIKRNKKKNAEYLVMRLWWLILHVNLMRDAKRCMNNWLDIISGCVWRGSRRYQHVNCWTPRSRRPFSVGGRHPSRWGLSRARRGGKLNACSACVYEVWHDRLPPALRGLALTICPLRVRGLALTVCPLCVWGLARPSAPRVYEVWHDRLPPAVLVLRPPHWTALYTVDPLSFRSLNYTTSFPGSLARR